jgi:hypothetical protein
MGKNSREELKILVSYLRHSQATNHEWEDFAEQAIQDYTATQIAQAKAEERQRIEKEIRAGWKYGDLREGNFENFMEQTFNQDKI